MIHLERCSGQLFFFPLGVWLFLPPFTLASPACLLSAFSTPGPTVKPRCASARLFISCTSSARSSPLDLATFIGASTGFGRLQWQTGFRLGNGPENRTIAF